MANVWTIIFLIAMMSYKIIEIKQITRIMVQTIFIHKRKDTHG
jgi:hypothetical protein